MVRFETITKRYKQNVVLDRVSVELDNHTYGLLGPNGAGKTTLFRIVTNLISSNGGTVTADGKSERLQIGYLPQKFGAFRTLTAREQLLYFARLKQHKNDGIDWIDEVDRALELTHLTDQKDMKCNQLSGGMVRRLGIAQAILGRPDLILLDEPTVGLDIEERVRLKEMIEELRGEQPIMISSHIAEDIEATCRQVVVLKKGRVIFTGEIDALSGMAAHHVWKMPEQIFRQNKNGCKQIGYIEENGERLVKVLSMETEAAPDASAVPLAPRLEDGYLYLLAKDDGK
ncbi:MAG: ATP-binding cassette domain-containing protein [Eubacteriales bacterium]|nr:ATP-binding cassette domain-containing protein [Eubacteriales bacterium]